MTALRRDRPGYQHRKRADGSVAHYWNPRRAVKAASAHLVLRKIADDASDADIVALCRQWTDELIADLYIGRRSPTGMGTIGALVTEYRTHAESPYQALKASTKRHDYDPMLNLFAEQVGKVPIQSVRGEDFRRWHRTWSSGGRVHRGHNAMRKLRALLSFGVEQKLPHCSAAREILSLIRFEAPAPRKIKMEFEHAKAIVEKAIEMGRASIALTQALQWDTALRRIDIIGEWLPVKEGEGGIIRGRTRWHGPYVSVISKDLILTIEATSKTGAESVHDLTLCPLTMSVLQRAKLLDIGPLVVSEKTGIPYRDDYYVREFRAIARAAGVPDEIWSMDSRAGAISEAEMATGDIDAARKLATHSNSKTTMRYVRNKVLDSNRATAIARGKLRD